MIGVAGQTYRMTLTDGRTFDVRPTAGDEVGFEARAKTSLTRLLSDGALPMWVILGIIHFRLLRDHADVPAEFDEFADLLTDSFDIVDEGKAEASDPTPPTG